MIAQWAANDPRNSLCDDFVPTPEQRQRRMSEADVWDDDGRVNQSSCVAEKLPENAVGVPEPAIARINEEEEDDEAQLQAIAISSDLPLPEDGGVPTAEKDKLKIAAGIPLPSDEWSGDAVQMPLELDSLSTSWRERAWAPFNQIAALPGKSQRCLEYHGCYL